MAGRQVRSIKGELVDFDLFEVKKQIGEKPISVDVENRERFVYSKRKRGSKRTVNKMLEDQQKNANSVRDALESQAIIDEAPVEKSAPVVVKERVAPKRKVASKKKKATTKRRIIKNKKGK